MSRPCFLVVDREHPASISTRKLVIETAKLNVITAYSGTEALETLQRFPAVDGIVLDAGIRDIPCSELIERFRAKQPQVPIVVIGSPTSRCYDSGDHFLESFEPSKLLALLQKLIPEAQQVKEREQAELSTEPVPPTVQ